MKPESEVESGLEGLNLTAALRILHHAGRPDPAGTGKSLAGQVQGIIDALCDLSLHDGLTGLVNATFFHAALMREVDRSARTGRSCGLLVLDIDHFKSVNDTYGHAAGDLILQFLARRVRESLRAMDTAARIGGEEFAVILPECSPEGALRAATRVHRALSPLELVIGRNVVKVTVSAGLVWTDVHVSIGASTLLALADQEMYRAKRSGRDRLCHTPIGTTQISADERALLISSPPGGPDAN
jgi:diguanylate cyclase